MKRFIALVLLLLSLCVKPQDQPSLSSLRSGFQKPPLSAKPKALWPWVNGNVSLSQITYELEEAKRKGMAGFDIWDVGILVDPNRVVPAGPAFLGNESTEAIAYTVREANRLGLEIGLSLSSSWNAGGAWVKPEHGAMGLFRSDTIVTGPSNFSNIIPFPTIPSVYKGKKTLVTYDPKTGLPSFYKEVITLAHPVNEDSSIASVNAIFSLQQFIDGNRILHWQVLPGKWRIVRYVCAPTGQPLEIPSPNSNGLMLDHFSATAQQANLQ